MSGVDIAGLVERLRDERHCNDWYLRQEASDALDEALAALKASEERGERLSQALASARLRPEPSGVAALRACHAFLCEQAPNNDALLDMIDAALAQEEQP